MSLPEFIKTINGYYRVMGLLKNHSMKTKWPNLDENNTVVLQKIKGEYDWFNWISLITMNNPNSVHILSEEEANNLKMELL